MAIRMTTDNEQIIHIIKQTIHIFCSDYII